MLISNMFTVGKEERFLKSPKLPKTLFIITSYIAENFKIEMLIKTEHRFL